jgi:hypothetical protein
MSLGNRPRDSQETFKNQGVPRASARNLSGFNLLYAVQLAFSSSEQNL